MAKRELVTRDSKKEWGFNVSSKIGLGRENQSGDVMVVQAMLNYLVEIAPDNDLTGLLPTEVPEVTGLYNAKTQNAITRYQRCNHLWLLKVDGVIHPANYKNRNIRTNYAQRLMTITRLHTDIVSQYTGNDYTVELMNRYPQLSMQLSNNRSAIVGP